MFLLDNGDVNAGYGRQPELKYETAMKAMAGIGYDGVNVGEQDLLLGLDYLQYVADFTGVPLLSANIMTEDGAPVFDPYVVRNFSGRDIPRKAAAIGVISTEFGEEIETVNPGLIVEEYDAILEQLVGKLRGESDVLILLAHMGEEEAEAVAQRFPQLDLVVVGHSGDDPFLVPIVRDGVPIVFAGNNGMHVGVATFRPGAEGMELSRYSSDKLDGKYADSQRMTGILADYQQMLRAENLLASHPRIEHSDAQFVGNDQCMRCHSLPTVRFRKSKHSHAFDPLVEKGHDYDPECVSCHTVGFGYVTGFVSPDETPAMKHVGCENCHGPGGVHIEEPLEKDYGQVERQTCESCHNPENSPTFVYEERIKKIKHNSFFMCSARICHWLE